jgi:hypothetical protein
MACLDRTCLAKNVCGILKFQRPLQVYIGIVYYPLVGSTDRTGHKNRLEDGPPAFSNVVFNSPSIIILN